MSVSVLLYEYAQLNMYFCMCVCAKHVVFIYKQINSEFRLIYLELLLIQLHTHRVGHTSVWIYVAHAAPHLTAPTLYSSSQAICGQHIFEVSVVCAFDCKRRCYTLPHTVRFISEHSFNRKPRNLKSTQIAFTLFLISCNCKS